MSACIKWVSVKRGSTVLDLPRVQMDVVQPAPRRQMMDKRIDSAVYDIVLKWTHEFPTER